MIRSFRSKINGTLEFFCLQPFPRDEGHHLLMIQLINLVIPVRWYQQLASGFATARR